MKTNDDFYMDMLLGGAEYIQDRREQLRGIGIAPPAQGKPTAIHCVIDNGYHHGVFKSTVVGSRRTAAAAICSSAEIREETAKEGRVEARTRWSNL